MNKKDLLDRCARSGEERVLLARVMDKLELAQNRGVPVHTPFLSPGERAAVEDLLRLCGPTRSLFWGGYPDAERAACVFLPDWQEAEDVTDDPEGPVAAVEGTFPTNADLGHRDVLGALMGLGITREKLGDILFPEKGRCQVAVLREALPILDLGAATPEAIDAAMKYGPGFRYPILGPLEAVDLGGLHIFRAVSDYLFADLGKEEQSPLLGRLADEGRKGVTTGSGIYQYAPGQGEEKLRWRNDLFQKELDLLKDV